VKIDMGPGSQPGSSPLGYKDAIFLSPHKFIGGPGTPGILLVKRKLLTNLVPSVPGGGTVSYVSPEAHTYLTDSAHREEGGTPAIIESIRAGLVFHLKEAVGAECIEKLEHGFVERATRSWSKNPKLEVLGNPDAQRLSIVSFVIKHGDDQVLHHNFVVALLNDLFGIQARGGCSCAGPYGHRLLGIDLARSMRFHEAIDAGGEGIKPGWVRVNFNYFISDEVFNYIVEAIDRNSRPGRTLRLDDISYGSGRMQYRSAHITEPESALGEYMEEAWRIIELMKNLAESGQEKDATPPTLGGELERLRWFPLPGE